MRTRFIWSLRVIYIYFYPTHGASCVGERAKGRRPTDNQLGARDRQTAFRVIA